MAIPNGGLITETNEQYYAGAQVVLIQPILIMEKIILNYILAQMVLLILNI